MYDYWKNFSPPKLPNQDVIDRLIAKLRKEFLVEDVYGNWVPRMPKGPSLDGIPVEEWNSRQEKLDKHENKS